MQRHLATPAEYIAAVPEAQRALFDHLRALIQEAAPTLREGVRWGMLAYEDTGALFALAAQKHFVGLYVMATEALKDMAVELAEVDHGKGCLRFKTLESVPTAVLLKLLSHAQGLHERDCRKAERC
jgi:uncharacterized protein YdhG (YjbR/CyaY superfamily)